MKTTKQMKMNLMVAMAMVAAGALLFSSCGGGGDDAKPKPTASFSYEADGKEVSFTSTSTNATGFSWDFGDGETSTDQNPVHNYESYGTYTVKLKVTGDGGEATSLPDELTLAKTSDVVINDDFADWSGISDASTSSVGTLTKFKIDYDALKIYLYVEGTEDMKGWFNIYIDSDNNSATGTPSPDFDNMFVGMGADYLVDGYIGEAKDADLFKDNPNVAGWCWQADCSLNPPVPVLAKGNNFVSASDLKTIGEGKKAIEFSLLRSGIVGLGSKFNIAIQDIDAGGSWASIGSVPTAGTPESVMYKMDLTK